MSHVVLWLVLRLVTLAVAIAMPFKCRSDESNPYRLFGETTSYTMVQNDDVTVAGISGCEAKKIWLLGRHGSRYPSEYWITKMTDRMPKIRQQVLQGHASGRGQLCPQELATLSNWKLQFSLADAYIMPQAGSQEWEGLGDRFRQRWKGRDWDRAMNRDKYEFRHTKRQRTKASATAFAKTAFKGQEVEMVPALDSDEDFLLLFYTKCQNWVEGVYNKIETFRPLLEFYEGSNFQTMVENVNRRLGFSGESEPLIDKDDITLIYLTCTYEFALNPESRPVWCSAFNDEDLKVLEYVDDVKYYYMFGPAFEINSQFGCSLFKDIKSHFNDELPTSSTARFYFGHIETLLPLLTTLQVYQDTAPPLTARNYAQQDHRQFRLSSLAAFAGNVQLTLFQCQEEPAQRVSLYVGEVQVPIRNCPGSPEELWCDWNRFQELHKDSMECPFDEWCENTSSNFTLREWPFHPL